MTTFENAVQQAREIFPRHWRQESDYAHKCEMLALALVVGLPVADVKRSLETGAPGWRQLCIEYIERARGAAPAGPSAPLAFDASPPVQA